MCYLQVKGMFKCVEFEEYRYMVSGYGKPLSKKVPERFMAVPRESDTKLLGVEATLLAGLEAVLERWDWDGIRGKS